MGNPAPGEDLSQRSPDQAHEQDEPDERCERDDERDIRVTPNGDHDGRHEPELGHAHNAITHWLR